MALRRMVSKSLSTSRKWVRLYAVAGDLAEFCQSLFPLLVAHSDDYGRQSGDVSTVKLVVCPGSPRSELEVEQALVHLQTVGLITIYVQADGEKVIAINKFKPHQPGLKQRGGASHFEPPPQDAAVCRDLPRNAVGCREMPSELNGTELKGTEGKGIEGRGYSGSAAFPSPIKARLAREPAPDGNYRVALKLAHQVYDELNPIHPEDLDACGRLKDLLAKARILYDGDLIARALASVAASRAVLAAAGSN
jgi:hypothetical protein